MQSMIKSNEVLSFFTVVSRLSEEEFLRIAEINIAALNAATADLPADKVRHKYGLLPDISLRISIYEISYVYCQLLDPTS